MIQTIFSIQQKKKYPIPKGFLSRAVRVVFYVLCFLFLGTNIYMFFIQPLYLQSYIYDVLDQPFSSEPHTYLAKLFLRHNKPEAASLELEIAQSFETTTTDVLGHQDTHALVESWLNTHEENKKEIEHWFGVVREHPEYPDAYVQIGYLLRKNGNTTTAEKYFEIAKKLNPLVSIQ